MQNNCSFLLAKNDKNYVEYMAMCGIFSKVRDISSTLCYNVFKVRSVYKKRSGFFPHENCLSGERCFANITI